MQWKMSIALHLLCHYNKTIQNNKDFFVVVFWARYNHPALHGVADLEEHKFLESHLHSMFFTGHTADSYAEFVHLKARKSGFFTAP